MEDMRSTPLTQEVSGGIPVGEHHKKPLRVFLIILLVILVAWGLFVLVQQKPATQQEPAVDYTVQTADQGQVIGSFPKELIPEEGVTILSSSQLDYKNRVEQLPTVEYLSVKTIDENIASFKALLTTQGWTVVKEGTVVEASEVGVTNFYATKDGNDVNITLSNSDGGVKVLIAFVKRQ